jgi:hypothetical protein
MTGKLSKRVLTTGAEMKSAGKKLSRMLLSLNAGSDFSAWPCIEGFLARKNRALLEYGFKADNRVGKPKYAKLSMPEIWTAQLFKT